LANTKSAEKRIRSNERKRLRNQMYRSRVKTMIRKAEELIFGGESSEDAVREAISTLDRAAVKGIIHKNNAARRKSRLMKKLNTQQHLAEAVAAKPTKKATAKKATTKSAKATAAKPATTKRATATAVKPTTTKKAATTKRAAAKS
jgi:small subunit ribosomal protein S20